METMMLMGAIHKTQKGLWWRVKSFLQSLKWLRLWWKYRKSVLLHPLPEFRNPYDYSAKYPAREHSLEGKFQPRYNKRVLQAVEDWNAGLGRDVES
jgi:hypothetical protein